MTKPRSHRILKTLKDILIGLAVVLLVAIAFEKPVPFTDISFAPPPPVREVSTENIAQFEAQIHTLSPADLGAMLTPANHQPTLVVVYASWCGYCRKLLPNIAALKREGKIDQINLLFLSIDKNPNELASYLLAYGYNETFTPYRVDNTAPTTLADALEAKGSFFNGSIPHSLILNGNGKLVAEMRGAVNKERMLSALNEATH